MFEDLYISDELLEKIEMKLTGNIKKYILNNSKQINDFINDIYNEKYTTAVKVNEPLRYEKKRLRQTKLSWTTGATKEINNFATKKSKRGISSILHAAEFLYVSEPEEFQKVFKCESIEEYGKNIIQNIEAWRDDETKILTDFPYFNTRTKQQQLNALDIDVSVIMGSVLLSQNGLQDDEFSMKINYLIDNAYVSDGVGSYKNLEDETELPYYTHTLNIDNKEVVTYIDKTFVDELRLINKRVPLYDTRDDHIITTALIKRDSMFYTHKRLTINIGELTKAIYKSDNSRNYTAIVDRLKKMASLKFRFLEEGKGLEISSLFDLKFPDDDDVLNKGKVFLYFSDKFYEIVVDDQVTHIYTKELQKLESSDAVSLAFLLQKERLGVTNSDKPIKYSYSYFSEKIAFRKRDKIKEICEFIEEALKELEMKNTIVKSFKRIGTDFYIIFYPVEQEEMQALLKYQEETKRLIDIQPKELLN